MRLLPLGYAAAVRIIERCPACFGGKATAAIASSEYVDTSGTSRVCRRCNGSGKRPRTDRIDPTGKDVFALYGLLGTR